MYEQLELPLVFEEEIPTWHVYNRMDKRVQEIQTWTRSYALVIAYANSVGRGEESIDRLLGDYAEWIIWDYCRVRIGDWCIAV